MRHGYDIREFCPWGVGCAELKTISGNASSTLEAHTSPSTPLTVSGELHRVSCLQSESLCLNCYQWFEHALEVSVCICAVSPTPSISAIASALHTEPKVKTFALLEPNAMGLSRSPLCLLDLCLSVSLSFASISSYSMAVYSTPTAALPPLRSSSSSSSSFPIRQ